MAISSNFCFFKKDFAKDDKQTSILYYIFLPYFISAFLDSKLLVVSEKSRKDITDRRRETFGWLSACTKRQILHSKYLFVKILISYENKFRNNCKIRLWSLQNPFKDVLKLKFCYFTRYLIVTSRQNLGFANRLKQITRVFFGRQFKLLLF